MKTTISILGMAAMMFVMPGCKKDEVKPEETAKVVTTPDTATVNVLIDVKACATVQTEYKSATLDIRGIKVLSAQHGWMNITPVEGAWDLVSLQTATVPIAGITHKTKVMAGSITKIAFTIGDNNKLVVNDKEASCYKIASKEIVLDVQLDIKANAFNEIVINVDICGNISVETRYQQEPCYTLNPVFSLKNVVLR